MPLCLCVSGRTPNSSTLRSAKSKHKSSEFVWAQTSKNMYITFICTCVTKRRNRRQNSSSMLFVSLFMVALLIPSALAATSSQHHHQNHLQQQHHSLQQQQHHHQQQQQQQQLNNKHESLVPHAPSSSSLKLIRHPNHQTLVAKNPGTLMAVARALKMAKVECQYQMRHEPWDCPILDLDVKPSNMFGKLTTRSFRETSFIHSLLSAALAHSVTRACTDFMVTTCARGQSREGGHRENIEFGAMFAREFMEATHELSAWQPQHNNIIDTSSALAATGRNGSSSLVGRSAVSLASGNSYGAPPASGTTSSTGNPASRAPADYSPENSSRREKKLRFINAHNDEAGILLVISGMRKECKCHGLSGTCNMYTCWLRLSPFRDVATKLHQNLKQAIRFDDSTQYPLYTKRSASQLGSSSLNSVTNESLGTVKKSNKKRSSPMQPMPAAANQMDNSIVRGHNLNSSSVVAKKWPVARTIGMQMSIKSISKEDLLYGESSPDFCEPNEAYNIKGTKGRICSEDKDKPNSCERLCCKRGYRTEIRDEKYNCECVFKFCCQLECKTCTRRKMIHKCL